MRAQAQGPRVPRGLGTEEAGPPLAGHSGAVQAAGGPEHGWAVEAGLAWAGRVLALEPEPATRPLQLSRRDTASRCPGGFLRARLGTLQTEAACSREEGESQEPAGAE